MGMRELVWSHGIYYGSQTRNHGARHLAQIRGNALLLYKLVLNYPVTSINNGMGEDGWRLSTEKIYSKGQLEGDDRFATNPEHFADGIAKGCAVALLVKLNQIGSLIETQKAFDISHRAQFTSVISHRLGQTEIQHSQTSRRPPIAGRSRPRRCPVLTVWQKTVILSGSRDHFARPRSLLAGQNGHSLQAPTQPGLARKKFVSLCTRIQSEILI